MVRCYSLRLEYLISELMLFFFVHKASITAIPKVEGLVWFRFTLFSKLNVKVGFRIALSSLEFVICEVMRFIGNLKNVCKNWIGYMYCLSSFSSTQRL